jgi:hypothetical protein
MFASRRAAKPLPIPRGLPAQLAEWINDFQSLGPSPHKERMREQLDDGVEDRDIQKHNWNCGD